MLELADAGRQDVAGALLRPLTEVALTGFYLLYGGRDAWDVVASNHVFWAKRLPLGRRLKKVLEQWDVAKPKPINWTQLTKDVGDLLEERVPGGVEAAKTIREILYGGTSLVDVHGGFQPIAGHIVEDGDRWELAEARQDPGSPYADALVGAALLGTLASHVYEVFGLGTNDVDALVSSLDVVS